MRLRHIAALVGKDVRLHGRSVVLTQAGVVALVWFATRLERPPELIASLLFNLNFILALLWGEWFVSRERLKGTFGWVRTLPVSDRELVAAKFLATSACCGLLWAITSLPFTGAFFADGRMGTWAVLLLALIAFGSLSVAARWRFGQKLGLIGPLLVVLLPLLVFIAAKREGAEAVRAVQAFWDGPAGRALAAAALAGLLAASYGLTERWVRRSDTFQLLE